MSSKAGAFIGAALTLALAAGVPARAQGLEPAGTAAPQQAGALTVYKLPGKNPGPWGIALDARQRVWVTLDKTNQLGRLDPATGAWHVLTLPAGFRPFRIGPGLPGENALWVSDYDFEQKNRPGRLLRLTDPNAGAFDLFPVEGAAPALFKRTAAGLLFSDLNGGKVGTVPIPAAVQPGQVLVPTGVLVTPPGAKRPKASAPYGLALDPQGRVWYAEAGNERIVRAAGGDQVAFGVPEQFWAPSDLDVDRQGRVWVAGHATSALVALDPESGQVLREVRLRSPAPQEESPVARPNGIVALPDGVWVAEHEGGRIARVLYDSDTVVEYPLPVKKGWAQWVAPAPGGGVWYAAYGTGEIGRVAADAPAFHVRLDLPTTRLRRGQTLSGIVEITAVGSSAGELTLDLPDLPYKMTGRFDHRTVKVAPERPGTARFTVTAGAETDLGANFLLVGAHGPGVLVTNSAVLQVQKALLGLPGLQPGHLLGVGGAVAAGAGALALMRKRKKQ